MTPYLPKRDLPVWGERNTSPESGSRCNLAADVIPFADRFKSVIIGESVRRLYLLYGDLWLHFRFKLSQQLGHIQDCEQTVTVDIRIT